MKYPWIKRYDSTTLVFDKVTLTICRYTGDTKTLKLLGIRKQLVDPPPRIKPNPAQKLSCSLVVFLLVTTIVLWLNIYIYVNVYTFFCGVNNYYISKRSLI